MIKITARELSKILNGRVEGDPEAIVTHPAGIDQGSNGAISFLSNPKYLPYLYHTKSTVVVISDDQELSGPVHATLIRVPDAYAAFATLLQKFGGAERRKGIEQPSFIDPTAIIGNNVYIGAFAHIGPGSTIEDQAQIYPHSVIGEGVSIGANTYVYPHVTIYKNSVVGKNCIIHSGTVIGSDGFGFAPQANGSYQKIPQIGNVVIEDEVEVGSNVTIDRATMGSTIIRRGVKLDNLVQVAHNVEIGEHTVIAAQTGISGSTRIGKGCVIGGQVGIVGHIEIADGTRINAQSGVAKSITIPNKAITDSPAFEYNDALRSQVVYRNLPQLEKRLRKLEQLFSERKNSE